MILRKSALGAGFFSAAMLAAVAAHAQMQQPALCQREMSGWLDELKVDRNTVTNIYASHVRTLEGGSAGMTGWVTLNTCRGKIVFNMGSSCRRYETYTTGECRLPGVSSY